MEKQKIALVTGVTGGIGGAFAKALTDLGYSVFAPVRAESEARALELFADNPNLTIEACNFEDDEAVSEYLKKVSLVVPFFDLVILATGTFKWDVDFPGNDSSEREKNAKDELTKANFLTKAVFIAGLKKTFAEKLKNTKIILVSSQASKFEESDPKRAGEEGYVVSMQKVDLLGDTLKGEDSFFKVFITNPGLIDTPLARKQFTKETIGTDPDWENVPTPDEYAKATLVESNLI